MATLLIVLAATLAAVLIRNYYIAAPCTRDGSVRVQVANVAPQVSGQITEGAERAAGYGIALNVESVMDGGMNRQEALS
jgi:hypothetical protein